MDGEHAGGCECQVFTTDAGRGKIHEIIGENKILSAMAPYGLSEDICADRMIVRDKTKQRPGAENRLNSQTHAKMLITDEFIVHGSGNFTENSIQHQHEIYNVTRRRCCPEKYDILIEFFENRWENGEPLNGVNDTV